jgi:peroxiredoxin
LVSILSDIVPEATFPDYALPHQTGTVHSLSEIQGDNPLILTFARGGYCPKEHQQHLELATHFSKIAVAYIQVATTVADDHHALQEFRPDWDLSAPGLWEAWDAGDYSRFRGWSTQPSELAETT